MGTPGNHRVDSEIRYSLNDGNWEPLELGQFISLIEPSPGEYRFQLETLSSAVSGSKRTFTLTKLPHFYETWWRSEEHTSELQSLMRISYAVFCLKKKKKH